MSIESLRRSALCLLLGLLALSAGDTVEDSIVASLNNLYKTSISESTDEFYHLTNSLLVTQTTSPGSSQVVLLLNCSLGGELSLHYFKVQQDEQSVSILDHTVGEAVTPSDSDFAVLDKLIRNETNITVIDGRTLLSGDKQVLSVHVSSSEYPLNFTLVSRAFYNNSLVMYAAAVAASNTSWELYTSTRNATKLDLLASTSLPEPFFYLVFAAFVGIVLMYASIAYYWQRNNTLPFLKRREDQHFQFDMGTGRSQ